ncbi:MAG: ABC transporter permease [Parasporobacterium sp.]|nr:ABC transporter permease [Parasporobacterium sp.]
MLKRFIRDLKKYLAYSGKAAKAQLKSEVASSYLNWIWWILEPVCFTFIYYLVFGVLFHLKEEYMIAFIVIGVSLWDFFNRMMKNSVRIIRANKSIISKVYLPKYILLVVRLGVNGFKMAITFVIAIAAMIILGVPVTWHVFMAVPVLIVFILFTFGISCLLLHFGVFVADLHNIVDIVLKMVFYVTGVFYSIGRRIPGPAGNWLINANPVAYSINAMRSVLLYGKMPNLLVLLIHFVISLGLCILGIYIIYKNENGYVKSI